MVLVDVGLAALAVTLVMTMERLLRGPTDADRVAAADLAFLVFVAGVALLEVRLGATALFDLVIVATLVGFLATVAFARLVDRRDDER